MNPSPATSLLTTFSVSNQILSCRHLNLPSLADLVNLKIHVVQEDVEEKQLCKLLAIQNIVQYGCSSSGICL
jgi:hypothetical protein